MSGFSDLRKATMDAMVRDAVLSATAKLLGEGGLSAITMDRVAEEAGVAKGTLYNYFGDKASLLEESFHRLFDSIRSKHESIRASDRAPAEKIREVIRETAQHAEANRATFRAFVNSGYLISRRKQIDEPLLRVLEDIIEEGVGGGSFRRVPSRAGAEMVGGVVFFVIGARHSAGEHLSESDVNEMVAFSLHGLGFRAAEGG